MKRVEIPAGICLYDYLSVQIAVKSADIAKTMDNQKSKAGNPADILINPDIPVGSLSDEEIMEGLYDGYSNYIFTIVKNKCRFSSMNTEDIEDCYIDVIIKLCENGCRRIRQFKGDSTFKTFLTVLCRNLTIDFIRKEKKNKERLCLVDNFCEDSYQHNSLYGGTVAGENPEEQYILKERDTLLNDAYSFVEREMENLDDIDKLTATLRFKKDMAYREIDEFLGIDNSRYRLSKIFQKIRSGLDNDVRRGIEELLVSD